MFLKWPCKDNHSLWLVVFFKEVVHQRHKFKKKLELQIHLGFVQKINGFEIAICCHVSAFFQGYYCHFELRAEEKCCNCSLNDFLWCTRIWWSDVAENKNPTLSVDHNFKIISMKCVRSFCWSKIHYSIFLMINSKLYSVTKTSVCHVEKIIE